MKEERPKLEGSMFTIADCRHEEILTQNIFVLQDGNIKRYKRQIMLDLDYFYKDASKFKIVRSRPVTEFVDDHGEEIPPEYRQIYPDPMAIPGFLPVDPDVFPVSIMRADMDPVANGFVKLPLFYIVYQKT